MTYNDPYGQLPHPPVSGQPVSPSYYPPPGPPPPPPPWPGPPKDDGKKFLNMSGGVLALVIALVILLCCIGPIAFCFFGGFLSAVSEAEKPDPTVTITLCRVDDASRTVQIEYTVRNNSDTEDSYSVSIDVVNAAGARVGEGHGFTASVGPGATARDEAVGVVTLPGGMQCQVRSVR